MQVQFEARDPRGAEFKDFAVQRIRFALRRLSWLVPRAHVRLSDANGPRGGVDKCCRVEIKTRRSGVVVITAIARDWRSALDSAISRAARTLVREWQRKRQTRHTALKFETH
jgi:ribosome-associated translation inhibitor RaiA